MYWSRETSETCRAGRPDQEWETLHYRKRHILNERQIYTFYTSIGMFICIQQKGSEIIFKRFVKKMMGRSRGGLTEADFSW